MSKSSKAAREVNGNNQLVADINDTCEKAIDRPLVTTGYYSARTMTGRTICVCAGCVCFLQFSIMTQNSAYRLPQQPCFRRCPAAWAMAPTAAAVGGAGGGCCSSSQTWYFVSMMDVCMRTSDSLKGHRHAQPRQKCSMHHTAPQSATFFIDCV